MKTAIISCWLLFLVVLSSGCGTTRMHTSDLPSQQTAEIRGIGSNEGLLNPLSRLRDPLVQSVTVTSVDGVRNPSWDGGRVRVEQGTRRIGIEVRHQIIGYCRSEAEVELQGGGVYRLVAFVENRFVYAAIVDQATGRVIGRSRRPEEADPGD
jgi:hypothetical protein